MDLTKISYISELIRNFAELFRQSVWLSVSSTRHQHKGDQDYCHNHHNYIDAAVYILFETLHCLLTVSLLMVVQKHLGFFRPVRDDGCTVADIR
jgi:hypothetical protein